MIVLNYLHPFKLFRNGLVQGSTKKYQPNIQKNYSKMLFSGGNQDRFFLEAVWSISIRFYPSFFYREFPVEQRI